MSLNPFLKFSGELPEWGGKQRLHPPTPPPPRVSEGLSLSHSFPYGWSSPQNLRKGWSLPGKHGSAHICLMYVIISFHGGETIGLMRLTKSWQSQDLNPACPHLICIPACDQTLPCLPLPKEIHKGLCSEPPLPLSRFHFSAPVR